jgi:hypothetical protein
VFGSKILTNHCLEFFVRLFFYFGWLLALINIKRNSCEQCFFVFFPAEPVAFSEAALRQNAAVLDYCRTSMCALAGSTAGIMGLTGLYGFIFYFITAFILSVSIPGFKSSIWDLSYQQPQWTTSS